MIKKTTQSNKNPEINPDTNPESSVENFDYFLQPREQELSDANKCCLCGSELQFDYRMDSKKQLIQEKSSCLQCHIKFRSTSHPMH